MTMQKIAMENNLAETAFYIREGSDFHIRWFTPIVEVDLCGHATLAAAHVLYEYENYGPGKIIFNSRSGMLSVKKENDLLTLDFPADSISEMELSTALTDGFNHKPVRAYKGKTDFMLVFESEEQIRTLEVDLGMIAPLKCRGVIATAPGKKVDFVSRFFAPQSGISEDPVTGSAHTLLTPYWARVLDKTELSAMQLSARGGRLWCTLAGDRTKISGEAKTYLIGHIFIG